MQLEIVNINQLVFKVKLVFKCYCLEEGVKGLTEGLVKNLVRALGSNFVGSRVNHRVVLKEFAKITPGLLWVNSQQT